MKCIYCNNLHSTMEHFVCEECGDYMCDDCYEADLEHEYHYHMPIENISQNMQTMIDNWLADDGKIKKPDYLCDRCANKFTSYAEMKRQ